MFKVEFNLGANTFKAEQDELSSEVIDLASRWINAQSTTASQIADLEKSLDESSKGLQQTIHNASDVVSPNTE